MHVHRTLAEETAEQVLKDAQVEFDSLGEKLDLYKVDVELIAALMFDLGVQPVPDLRVGVREYAGFLDADAQLIVVEANHHSHRQRFSIAHEIGHYVLHVLRNNQGQRLFSCTSSDMELSSTDAASDRAAHQRRELEANQFASALLMPEQSVRAMYKVTGGSVRRLTTHFGVSPQAMEIRLSRLGLEYRSISR